MNTLEYLDAAKAALNITSDYELAKRLDVSKQAISNYRKGNNHPDSVMAFKLAITLKLDPAMVLADLESQREPTGKRGDFWRSFLARAVMVGILVFTVALNFSATCGAGAARLGGKRWQIWRFRYA